MSKDYGSSIYAAVLVLNTPELVDGHGFQASLRRPIQSKAFVDLFGAKKWRDTFTPDDQIGAIIPVAGRKYSGRRQIRLTDGNGDKHECIAEAFTQGHQIFVLIHAVKTLNATTIIIPKPF